MIANLDLVAPILTIFFLMCYLFVNVSTTICSLMQAPSWRPSFKYYHWSTSLLGACCCLLLIFLTSVLYAIVAFLIAGGIYFAIARWGAKKEWGDAIKGMSMSIALQALVSYNFLIFMKNCKLRDGMVITFQATPKTGDHRFYS